VRRRIARYKEEIRARRLGEEGYRTLLQNVRGQGPPPTERQRRAVYGVHCPFLENGRCSIYPVRPLMCREHISFDDPGKCERDEPFLGLDKPRFSEVSAYLTMDAVPPKGQMRPVYEFEEAARSAEKAAPVRPADLNKVLRWKTGR
jgi:Fe-S-cluster containining protein